MPNDNFAGAEKALSEKGEFSSYTSGTSMYPLLRTHRDIVIIKPPHFPLKAGDTPLYRKKGKQQLVLHRILKVQGEIYVIRGDNTYFKEYVAKKDIVGVLDGVLRNANTKKCKYINCNTDKGYKVYVFFVRLFFPFRFLWKRILEPVLLKIRHLIKVIICKIFKLNPKKSFKENLKNKK